MRGHELLVSVNELGDYCIQIFHLWLAFTYLYRRQFMSDLRLYSQPTLEAYSTHTHADNLISHSCERITVRFGMHMSHSHSNSTQISSKR